MTALVLVWAVLFAPAIRAQEAGWLYQVDVPVADQSPAARQQAARDGLAIVLSRVTGIASVPDDPRVRRALGNPDPYYVQFSYQRGAAPGELLVRLQFSASALFQLIRETGLPIWPSNRPAVLAWALVDEDGALRIPAADSGDPVERAMLARAAERGLVVRLATLERPVGELPAEPPSAALPPGAAPAAAAPGDAARAAAGPVPAGAAQAAPAPGVSAQGAAGTPSISLPVEAASIAGGEAAAPAGPREPEDVALRPALPDGTPVWPTVGYWNAGLPELLALSKRGTGQLRVIARLQGSADGRWSGDVTIHDPSATPPPAPAPAEPAATLPAAGAAPAAVPGPTAPAIGSASQAAPGATTPPPAVAGQSAAPAAGAGSSAPQATAPGPAPTVTSAAPPLAPVGPVVLQATAPTAEALAAALVDRVVEYLLGRFQVEAGDSGVVVVSVSGLDRARDYAEVLRIFSRVEVVSEVAVVGAAGDQVRFALTTNAAQEQLQALVTAGGRLVLETPAPIPAEPLPSAEPAAPQVPAPVEPAAPADPFAATGGQPRPALELRWQGS